MSDAAKTNINTRMPKGAKRPKTSRACLACRKLKARCEHAGGAKATLTEDSQSSHTIYNICHRCKTLCIDCLYESPSGQVVKGEDLHHPDSTPSPAAELNRPPRSSKRSRSDDHNAAASDPFSNDRAVFLSPAISPSPLTRCVYRDIDICSLNSAPSTSLERPVFVANAFSRLIGTNPALKQSAQDHILRTSGAFPQDIASSYSWKQAPADLCAGKAAARLMSGQTDRAVYPQNELIFLSRVLQPHEHSMRILFEGLYGAFSPFLSIPFEDSLNLSSCHSEAQCFLLLTIYLIALPHLEPTLSLGAVRKPLRKAVDALLRRAIHSAINDHLNIFALHNCASFLLLPVDGMVNDYRPVSTPEQENDGLLEFASDLSPRATIITALVVAQRLGYATMASKLPALRQSIEAESPANGQAGDLTRDEYAHAVLCTFTWLTLLQFRASIDVAEDRIEWDSLAQFEHDIPRLRMETLTASLLPPPSFLSPREQSRCCWMAQRAELYAIARDLRHTKRACASFSKKEAEEQAAAYKKAVDEWRYKFNEQMRSMSIEFRKDARGLGLHRYYSIFANAEAQSLQVSIGSVYHKEFASDMRQRLEDPFYQENRPWKSASTIMLGHEKDRITKAILINFAFTDAMLKAMGLISSLTPVMPQLYDFVSYEETVGSEIPSLCIVAPPNVQAGLFAVPLLAAADLRLSVIETWGASASYFNHHLLPLLTNCVKSLRACHVNVSLPGVLKIPFTTANPVADYLQGPFEILMRKVASAEERLQISHVESILTNAFQLSRKKKEIEAVAEELAPEAPEMVQAIADSQKIEDEISSSMMGSLHVQAIQEIEERDTDYAVKVFGSDLREGDLTAVRKPGRSVDSSAATPDADNSGSAGDNVGSIISTEKEHEYPPQGALSATQQTLTHTGDSSALDVSGSTGAGSSMQLLHSLHSEAPLTLPNNFPPHQGFSAQDKEPTYSSDVPRNHGRPPLSAFDQQPPLTEQVVRLHAVQSDALYSTASYLDPEAPAMASSRRYTQSQGHDERPTYPDNGVSQSTFSAYDSFSSADGRPSNGGVLGTHVSDPNRASRPGPSDDAYSYPAGVGTPHMQTTNAHGSLHGRSSNVNAEGLDTTAGYPRETAWHAGAAGAPLTEAWPQTVQQPPQYGDVRQPDPGFRDHFLQDRHQTYLEGHAPRPAETRMTQNDPYYMTQPQAPPYAGQPNSQYQVQHPAAGPRYVGQQQQMHPDQHDGSSVGMDGHDAAHSQPNQGEGQPPSNANWDVWNWTPAQQQQHQDQMHHQQQQQHYQQQPQYRG